MFPPDLTETDIGNKLCSCYSHLQVDMKFIFRFFSGAASVAAAFLCLACSLSSFAASTTVTVGSPTDRFTPAVVNINVGDKVIWNWVATPHSTTSGTNGVPSGLWDSHLITSGLPHFFTNTFLSSGKFIYFCSMHFNMGMTGAVFVASASLPPGIAITNPLSGAVFAAPASVTIQASPTNGSGTVTNVQFLVGSTVLTNETAAPFSAVTNNVAAGNYTLTAIAMDSGGFTATNSVNITVDSPPSVTITNPLNNATLSSPANVIIQASASDSDGTVTNVQFLVGSTVLTNEIAPPFSAATNNLAAGSYNLSAIAFDNLGVKNTNAVSISVVTPVTVFLTNSAKLSSTSFQFSYPANVGLSYIVQISTNLALTNWITLVTNVAASNPVVFVDNLTTNMPGFYRVGRLPNP
jgi:plastocyanin